MSTLNMDAIRKAMMVAMPDRIGIASYSRRGNSCITADGPRSVARETTTKIEEGRLYIGSPVDIEAKNTMSTVRLFSNLISINHADIPANMLVESEADSYKYPPKVNSDGRVETAKALKLTSGIGVGVKYTETAVSDSVRTAVFTNHVRTNLTSNDSKLFHNYVGMCQILGLDCINDIGSMISSQVTKLETLKDYRFDVPDYDAAFEMIPTNINSMTVVFNEYYGRDSKYAGYVNASISDVGDTLKLHEKAIQYKIACTIIVNDSSIEIDTKVDDRMQLIAHIVESIEYCHKWRYMTFVANDVGVHSVSVTDESKNHLCDVFISVTDKHHAFISMDAAEKNLSQYNDTIIRNKIIEDRIESQLYDIKSHPVYPNAKQAQDLYVSYRNGNVNVLSFYNESSQLIADYDEWFIASSNVGKKEIVWKLFNTTEDNVLNVYNLLESGIGGTITSDGMMKPGDRQIVAGVFSSNGGSRYSASIVDSTNMIFTSSSSLNAGKRHDINFVSVCEPGWSFTIEQVKDGNVTDTITYDNNTSMGNDGRISVKQQEVKIPTASNGSMSSLADLQAKFNKSKMAA